ncbi:MAG: hypothetical protein LUD47_05430 [Clostridia bacterium]|nr:hypothetical protein [Clostridia bacterium]
MRTRKALIICEGYEEEACPNRLCGCGVWNAGITVEVENAKSENAKPLKPGEARSGVSVCKDKFAMGD